MSYLPFKNFTASELFTDIHDVTSVDIARLAQHGLALRQWERQHLPTEGTQLGYEVFMKLAELVATDSADTQAGLLKRLYLALPYSEKGIRLHLRRLESTGWITVHKIGDDGRTVRVELSSEYWRLLNAYAVQWGGGRGRIRG
ncbi:MAG: hypothetical protein QE285_07190 [Aquabacterium sp.]|nr:hypothetical protein [Aquabacterium sp.]